jgi:hypothetical protein
MRLFADWGTQIVAGANIDSDNSSTWATGVDDAAFDPVSNCGFGDAVNSGAFFNCVVMLHFNAFQRSRLSDKTPIWNFVGRVGSSSLSYRRSIQFKIERRDITRCHSGARTHVFSYK